MYQLNNAYQVYESNQVNTASKGRLLLMLYDGTLKFLRQASNAIEAKDVPKAHESLVKAQDIICSLMDTLNPAAGQISDNLYSLYDYIYREMVAANIHKDKEKVDMLYDMVLDLRRTWAQII
ncbi:MAG: flagellar export chaperone FliS [Caldicoprobacterales bacterium]|jgi:flagellar protein FliS|nr:flagellar export chaperone FliS [Clostridia bacterium]MDI9512431.1 flagellar export chaperone FliS [Bacillota bacterium]NLH57887.1 flagellar export chaperone FliS [Clostridiales bacterium]